MMDRICISQLFKSFKKIKTNKKIKTKKSPNIAGNKYLKEF